MEYMYTVRFFLYHKHIIAKILNAMTSLYINIDKNYEVDRITVKN